MIPPVYQIAMAHPPVVALINNRLWPFGEAPRNADGTPAGGTPYAVWQITYGSPDNTLSCTPGMDNFGVQFDGYGTTAASARNVISALRDAYELTYNHVVSWNGEFKDEPTGLFRVSMTVEFWTPR